MVPVSFFLSHSRYHSVEASGRQRFGDSCGTRQKQITELVLYRAYRGGKVGVGGAIDDPDPDTRSTSEIIPGSGNRNAQPRLGFDKDLLKRRKWCRRQRVPGKRGLRERHTVDVDHAAFHRAPLRRKRRCDDGRAATADLQQCQGFGHHVAAQRGINFLDDDVKRLGTEATHDIAHPDCRLRRRQMTAVGIDRDHACPGDRRGIALHGCRHNPGFDAGLRERPGAVQRPGQVVRNDEYPRFFRHSVFTSEPLQYERHSRLVLVFPMFRGGHMRLILSR